MAHLLRTFSEDKIKYDTPPVHTLYANDSVLGEVELSIDSNGLFIGSLQPSPEYIKVRKAIQQHSALTCRIDARRGNSDVISESHLLIKALKLNLRTLSGTKVSTSEIHITDIGMWTGGKSVIVVTVRAGNSATID